MMWQKRSTPEISSDGIEKIPAVSLE